MSQDFVNVPVPADRVLEVYELLGRPKGSAASHASTPEAAPVEPTVEAFDPDLLARAYRESPDTMKQVFKCLADNAGHQVPMAQLAAAVGREPKQMSGALGAFGRRWKNRYHKGVDAKWPFSSWWNFEINSMIYRMSPEAAEVINRIR